MRDEKYIVRGEVHLDGNIYPTANPISPPNLIDL